LIFGAGDGTRTRDVQLGKLGFKPEVSMRKAAFTGEIGKTVEQLRQSPYHQQLGRKMCSAFIAQQQGIGLETALKAVSDPVGDLWLIVAEIARQGFDESAAEGCMQFTPPTGALM
jgi:hypothetical protein